jgi:endonuclease YncB( thermonuclease family)
MRRRDLVVLLPLIIAAGLFVAGRTGGVPEPVPPAKAERQRKPTGDPGSVLVVDGDTLRIGAARIRLHGIDAPERAQLCAAADGQSYRCGEEATAALVRLLGDRRPDCVERDRDSYGRSVAICSVAGRDLNRAMVAAGWALAYTRYSRDYEGDEAAARRARRGLWQGRFARPDQYRAERRGRRS